MAQIALVTGAGSGIGRHSALALVRDGMTVVLAGRRQKPLDETKQRAEQLRAGSSVAVPADVSNPDDVKALFDKIETQFGRLDVLFNNAGLNIPATPIDEVKWEDWRRVIDVDLSGVFLCTQQAFRLMKNQSPQGGRIINNGSISAHVPRPFSAAYTAAKHGVTGLTRSTSLDGRPFHIACGQIDIGNASTEMTSRMSGGVPQADGSMAAEPTMHVENVAKAVAYMASLPLDANVPFMTVMANGMPYIGRG